MAVVASTPNRERITVRFARLVGVNVSKNPYHFHEFDFRELEGMMTEHGFEIVFVRGLYLPLLPGNIQLFRKVRNMLCIYKLLVDFVSTRFGGYLADFYILARKK